MAACRARVFAFGLPQSVDYGFDRGCIGRGGRSDSEPLVQGGMMDLPTGGDHRLDPRRLARVQPVDHLHDKPRQVPLRQPVITDGGSKKDAAPSPGRWKANCPPPPAT